MIKVIADGKEFQVEEGTRIVDFINLYYYIFVFVKTLICILIGGRL